MLSNRAAAVAVIVAFLVGIAGSLAIRPPTGTVITEQVDSSKESLRIHWRVPVSNPTNLPVIGENPVWGKKQKIRKTISIGSLFSRCGPSLVSP